MSNDTEICIRMARVDDAPAIAGIYVDSWRETYAGILPVNALVRMSKTEQARSWRRLIDLANLRNPVFVASDIKSNLYGFASAGPSRDSALNFDAEIYTIYVSPGFTGQGIGTALMTAVFRLLSKAPQRGMIIWALADNPSRFFYESMGGRIVAERMHPVWGQSYREIAYGWDEIELPFTSGSSRSTFQPGNLG